MSVKNKNAIQQYGVAGYEVHAFVSPIIKATTYCVVQEDEGLLIDAVDSSELYEFLSERSIKKVTVLLTHGHYDHILGIPELRRRFEVLVACSENGVEVLKNPRKNLTSVANLINSFRKDLREINIKPLSIEADDILTDRQVYEWHGLKFKVVYTPGHSPDSVCFLMEENCVFVGDTMLQNKEVLLRFPGGSKEDYYNYTKPILKSLPDNLIVFPGHGDAFSISECTCLRSD